MEEERNRLLYKAAIACKNHLDDDFYEIMKEVVELGGFIPDITLTALFSSIQLKTNKLRKSWEKTKEKFDMTIGDVHSSQHKVNVSLLNNIENDLRSTCLQTIDFLKYHVIKHCINGEMLITAKRLIADNYQYLSCLSSDEEANHLIRKAKRLYLETLKFASTMLGTSHPARLLLAMHYCVILHDVTQEYYEAYYFLRQCILDALDDCDRLGGVINNQKIVILEKMRDYWRSWRVDVSETECEELMALRPNDLEDEDSQRINSF